MSSALPCVEPTGVCLDLDPLFQFSSGERLGLNIVIVVSSSLSVLGSLFILLTYHLVRLHIKNGIDRSHSWLQIPLRYSFSIALPCSRGGVRCGEHGMHLTLDLREVGHVLPFDK